MTCYEIKRICNKSIDVGFFLDHMNSKGFKYFFGYDFVGFLNEQFSIVEAQNRLVTKVFIPSSMWSLYLKQCRNHYRIFDENGSKLWTADVEQIETNNFVFISD